MSRTTLAIAGRDHALLERHLLPIDGREAAAILLCGRSSDGRDLFVRHVHEVPHDECSRTRDRIVWPGARLAEAQAEAEDEGCALILVHSHPGGLFEFSALDDLSDGEVLSGVVAGWCGAEPPLVGSAIMVPGGAMRARIGCGDAGRDVDVVRVAGDEIRHWHVADGAPGVAPMAFGSAMTGELRRRRACVVGVSGTGSIVAEQLARLGFGGLTLIDFDVVEPKNLNRILNSSCGDAKRGVSKVEMFAASVRRHRPGIELDVVDASLLSRSAVLAASRCDVIFSCVDSSEGRQVADLVAQAFLVPLVDMGVSIPTRRLPDGSAAIAEVLGRIDYVQPGASSLASRGVFTSSSLRAEYMRREAPEEYVAELADGYIKGVAEEAPAVISLNMRTASAAVIEYLARCFPFRHGSNAERARTLFRLAEGEEETFAETEFDVEDWGMIGAGAAEPLLGMPGLGMVP